MKRDDYVFKKIETDELEWREHNNQCKKVPKTKSGEGFWTRAVYLANLFGKHFNCDIKRMDNFKERLIKVYFNYSDKKFDYGTICTWRI